MISFVAVNLLALVAVNCVTQSTADGASKRCALGHRLWIPDADRVGVSCKRAKQILAAYLAEGDRGVPIGWECVRIPRKCFGTRPGPGLRIFEWRRL